MNVKPKLSTNHLSLKVKDLQASFRFYHHILQLPVVRIIGPQDNPRLIFLQGLELSQVGPDDEWVPPPKTGFFGHIGFEVENIDAWIERLEAAGVQFTLRFRDVRFEDEKMAVKVSFFLDPNGIPLELVEWRTL
jgi:catechol 2,3-dioxygenase-like lactoylglutathione lyase family enzyme